MFLVSRISKTCGWRTESSAKELVRSLFRVPLRILVLHLIALNGEMHGYEIMKKIEDLTMGLWRPGTSTLYMVLENLVKEGLLEPHYDYRGRVKRVRYRITEKGLELLRLSIDAILNILYRVISWLEDLNKKLEKIKPGTKTLTTEDIERNIDMLMKIREAIDCKIKELEKKLNSLRK